MAIPFHESAQLHLWSNSLRQPRPSTPSASLRPLSVRINSELVNIIKFKQGLSEIWVGSSEYVQVLFSRVRFKLV
ncbi:hypothetical protein RYX36_004068 [Vicia faba]